MGGVAGSEEVGMLRIGSCERVDYGIAYTFDGMSSMFTGGKDQSRVGVAQVYVSRRKWKLR